MFSEVHEMFIEATSVRVNTAFFCEDKVIYLRWMVG